MIKHNDTKPRMKQHPQKTRLWIGLGASLLSGVLVALSMPNFDVSFLAWFGLVPVLLAIELIPDRSPHLLAAPCGVIWSIAVHNWYPHMFGLPLGIGLILLVGWWYTDLIGWGKDLERTMPKGLKLLAIPVLWTALDYLKYIIPVLEDWWFVLFAKSQWRFPPALQILSITGFPGLNFLLVLTNVAFASLLSTGYRDRRIAWSSLIAVLIVAGMIGWGAIRIPTPPQQTVTIAATTDMVNQDVAIQSLSKDYAGVHLEGPYADTPEMSQAIFDLNATLTRDIAASRPAFVVWPEHEMSDADDPHIIGQIGELAKELNAYIVVDVVWRAATGMHDTALMVGPNGHEIGRRAKINVTSGEKDYGFVSGPKDFPVFETPYGTVGLGVCWDRHRLWITRELARAGAQIVLMPVDDDFNHTRWFPAFHASDGVFRAVENRVAFGLSTTNGISLIVDPYGRIISESGINTRTVMTGNVFTTQERTLYTDWGDWFGWIMVAGLTAMLSLVIIKKRRHHSSKNNEVMTA